MKRKRAIKLLMAADGNGERSTAAEFLDKMHRNIPEASNLYIIVTSVWRIKISALYFHNFDTANRADSILRNLLSQHPQQSDFIGDQKLITGGGIEDGKQLPRVSGMARGSDPGAGC